MTEYISKTHVCNMALGLLGDFEIDDIEDNTDTNAKRCNRWYESNVRAVIRQFSNWNRCDKYFELTNDGVDPIPAGQFAFKVNIPANVISILEVRTGRDVPVKPWKVVGQQIYSNCSTIFVRTQVYVEDPNLWDAMMLNAVAARLAWILAVPITGSNTIRKEMKVLYDVMFEDAATKDSHEGSLDEITGQTDEIDGLVGL